MCLVQMTMTPLNSTPFMKVHPLMHSKNLMKKVFAKLLCIPLQSYYAFLSKGLDTIPKNYRPISNLTFISKTLEEAICQQLSDHLSLHSLEEQYQSAYRKQHSTETTLIRLFNNLLVQLDNRQAVYLTLLDLSAAFDTVDYDIYLSRLERSFGVAGGALDWMSSYLHDRSARVKIGSSFSNTLGLDCALPLRI